MQIGFFFWPYDPALVRRMAAAADRYGFDMIGIADTPGNAMDPWIAATLVAANTTTVRVGLGVTNLVSRQPAVSAAAIERFVEKSPSWYLDLQMIAKYVTSGGARAYHHTAPISMIYALHAGLGVVLEEGLENVQARHQACGDKLQAGLVDRGFEMRR